MDVAVSRSASGQATVLQALGEGAKQWATQQLHMLQQPAFKLCWFVYICTYAGANMIEDVCVLFLNISPVMPKFLGVTLCNMLACMYKDAALAQLYGKDGGEAKPFPKIGYFLFLIRDLLANGGGFTFPPLVEPLLTPCLGASAATVSQLGVPAAINIISSPIHFLALDIYNNPASSFGKRINTVAASYVGATSSRIMKGLAAYGIGGVGNTFLRGRIGLTSMPPLPPPPVAAP